MEAEDDELEYTLLNKREVLVYQIPPASSANGHKADDWKKCIWRGRCRIVGKGHDLSIKLIDASSGQLFAQCLIPKGEHEMYVERVKDSSRYFVLKITNGARHAFIGLGFEDRNDAFDFNCCLADFKSTFVDRETPEVSPTPAKDLSLKEGQKITVNLKGMCRKRDASKQNETSTFGGLAPPPISGQSRRAAAPVSAPVNTYAGAPAAVPPPVAFAAFDNEDAFGDFTGFQSAKNDPFTANFDATGAPSSAQPPTSAKPQASGFDEFDIFK